MILFDPIFQGLAISLMAGEVASLLLSRMAVQVLYMAKRHERADHVTVRRRFTQWCPMMAILRKAGVRG